MTDEERISEYLKAGGPVKELPSGHATAFMPLFVKFNRPAKSNPPVKEPREPKPPPPTIRELRLAHRLRLEAMLDFHPDNLPPGRTD